MFIEKFIINIISGLTFRQHLLGYNETVSLWCMWMSHSAPHSKVLALLFLLAYIKNVNNET